MACIKGFSYDCVPSNQLSYFSTKTYVEGTQKNRRNGTVLLRLNLMIKKILKKISSKSVFIYALIYTVYRYDTAQ